MADIGRLRAILDELAAQRHPDPELDRAAAIARRSPWRIVAVRDLARALAERRDHHDGPTDSDWAWVEWFATTPAGLRVSGLWAEIDWEAAPEWPPGHEGQG